MKGPPRSRRAAKRALMAATLLAVGLLGVTVTRYHIPDQVPVLGALQRWSGINGPGSLPDLPRVGEQIAHRACPNHHLEECTERAIRKAIASGFRRIEIDIRKCGTHLILFHDPRTGDHFGDPDDQSIASVSLETLAQLQQDSGYVEYDQQILLLERALELFAETEVTWVLDIKEAEMRDDLLPLLARHRLDPASGRVVLLGRFDIIEEYLGSGYPLAGVAAFTHNKNWLRFALGHQFILQRCDSLAEDLNYLVLPSPFLRSSLISQARERGLEIWAYGLQPRYWEKRDLQRAAGLGVSRLIVDAVH